jgi:hypothetical protein
MSIAGQGTKTAVKVTKAGIVLPESVGAQFRSWWVGKSCMWVRQPG